jgi:hypothetical protein
MTIKKYRIVFFTVDMLRVTVPGSKSGGARNFLVSIVIQSGTEAKPTFCQIGTGSFFLRSKLPRRDLDYHSNRTSTLLTNIAVYLRNFCATCRMF